MKKYTLLALLCVTPFLLNACMESTEPAGVENVTSMIVTKEKIMLDASTMMDSSIVALHCGCKFTFSVEAFTGDTNAIHYTERDATNGSYRVALDVSGDTEVAAGAYSASIAILGHSATKGTYRDTIEVEYLRN